VTLDRDTASSRGTFRIRSRLSRGGELFITTPRFRNLSPLSASLGRVTVKASVSVLGIRRSGRRIAVRGRAFPAAGRRRAVLQIRARAAGTRTFHIVRRVRLPERGDRYRVGVDLPAGRWQLSTRYADPGVVASGTSHVRSVSVP
jgi:hypothetical protein